jgi:hypothetical protein
MNHRDGFTRRALLALGAAVGSAPWILRAREASAIRAVAPAPLTVARGFDGAKTRAVVVGILQWQDPRFRGFPLEGRRDAVLVETLRRRGVPERNIAFLRDREATKGAIERSVAAALAATAADEMLLVYYAGHGARVDDGQAFFVPYDAASGRVQDGGWSMKALVDSVTAPTFRGRALLAADCCYSGALTREVEARTAGRPIATLTSSMASVVSTGNWTFTECLLAGLDGAGVCDATRDGRVTLEDLGRFTDAQMAFAEEQLATWTTRNGWSPSWVLASARARACAREGEHIEVLYRGQWYRAQIEGERPGAVRVHYIGYTRDWDEWVGADRCRAFSPQTFQAGSQIDVEWNGSWYPATVLEQRRGIHHIHYDGYTDVWNEWVASRRCRARSASRAAAARPTDNSAQPRSGRRRR